MRNFPTRHSLMCLQLLELHFKYVWVGVRSLISSQIPFTGISLFSLAHSIDRSSSHTPTQQHTRESSTKLSPRNIGYWLSLRFGLGCVESCGESARAVIGQTRVWRASNAPSNPHPNTHQRSRLVLLHAHPQSVHPTIDRSIERPYLEPSCGCPISIPRCSAPCRRRTRVPTAPWHRCGRCRSPPSSRPSPRRTSHPLNAEQALNHV